MPNGYIEAAAVKQHLATVAESLFGQYSTAHINDWADAIRLELVRQATTDLTETARQLVTADLESVGWDTTRTHKISVVTAIRTETGEGLREAKYAYEAAVPVALAKHATHVLLQLNDANQAVTYGQRQYVDASHHTAVLSNLQTAANDAGESPF